MWESESSEELLQGSARAAHPTFVRVVLIFCVFTMNEAPVSCIPNSKMSKAKKVLDEARATGNPELDLMEKGISTFEEMPGLCK